MTFTCRVRLLALVLCVAAVPASSALAGKKAASPPSVTSLAPLTLRVGDTLTIRGANFVPGKKRDKVTFKRDGAPAVTVKATEATRTRLKVVVPAALAKYLTSVAGGAVRAARFRVRVLAGRAASKGYTALKSSPVVVPANVPLAALGQLGTLDDPCAIDTGGVIDGVEGDAGTTSYVSDPAAAPLPCSVDTSQDDPSVDGQ
jgi:hypothetical protein